MPEIKVIAIAKAKPGKEKALEQELLAVIPITHEEKGCIVYSLQKSVQEQGVYAMVERWDSQADLDRHLAAPHIQRLFKNIADLVQAPPQLLVLETVPAGKPEKRF